MEEQLAGLNSQGFASIAIGFNAGQTLQPANSIVINSSGSIVNGITAFSCYINPIRNSITNILTNNFLCYDDTNKEIIQASNIEFASAVAITQGSLSNLSLRFIGDTDTGFCSPVADNVNIVTKGVDRVSISTTRMSLGYPLFIPNGSASAQV